MATHGTSSHSSVNNTTRRSYISTAVFDDYFLSYRIAEKKGNIIGILERLEGATCHKCPAGRILRETGRKLYPSANNGVKNYLVGVYDSVSLLNGFIDPNASVFAVYNSDRPTYIPNNADSSDNESTGSVDNYGAPVLTSGNVISTEGFVGIQSTIQDATTYAGEYLWDSVPVVEAGVNFPLECGEEAPIDYTYATLYPDGTIESLNDSENTYVRLTANGNILNTGNVSTLGSIYVDENLHVDDDVLVEGNISTLGNLYVAENVVAQKYFTNPVGSDTGSIGSPLTASAGVANFNSFGGIQTIYTTQVTSNSLVFVTVNNATPRYATVEINNGNFVVHSSENNDTSAFSWLVIN